MTNNIKLGTLVKYSEITTFYLHDIQYDITEIYTKSQIIKNDQLKKMKVINFTSYPIKNSLYVNVVE